MKRTTILQAAAAALSFAAASAANANLIVNGSFETPDVDTTSGMVGGSGWQVYNGSQVAGWDVAYGYGIEIQKSGTVVNAQHGDQYVELDSHGSNSNTAIYQLISGLTVGKEYELSFWYQPRTSNNRNDNGMDVFWGLPYDSVEIDSIANVVRDASTDWVQYTYLLTAIDTTMELMMAADGQQNSLGALVDNVSLVAVPEPGTLALLGLGLAGLGFARRKAAA